MLVRTTPRLGVPAVLVLQALFSLSPLSTAAAAAADDDDGQCSTGR
jgi:hypothetical protein